MPKVGEKKQMPEEKVEISESVYKVPLEKEPDVLGSKWFIISDYNINTDPFGKNVVRFSPKNPEFMYKSIADVYKKTNFIFIRIDKKAEQNYINMNVRAIREIAHVVCAYKKRNKWIVEAGGTKIHKKFMDKYEGGPFIPFLLNCTYYISSPKCWLVRLLKYLLGTQKEAELEGSFL